MGVLYWAGFESQLTFVKLDMPSETRRNVGFQSRISPAIIVLKVSPGDSIQSELLYPQKKTSSMFTPRPTHGAASSPVT